MPGDEKTVKLTVANLERGPRYVNTVHGQKLIQPGQSLVEEFTAGERDQLMKRSEGDSPRFSVAEGDQTPKERSRGQKKADNEVEDWNSKTVPELKDELEKRGVAVEADWRKADLVAALEAGDQK